jgi:hypothetical protein
MQNTAEALRLPQQFAQGMRWRRCSDEEAERGANNFQAAPPETGFALMAAA